MVNAWFVKDLGDAMLANEQLESIKTLFISESEKAIDLEERAIFFRHETEGHLHCVVKVYFSPGAVAVARACAATPCDIPSVDGLSLLIGSDSCVFSKK